MQRCCILRITEEEEFCISKCRYPLPPQALSISIKTCSQPSLSALLLDVHAGSAVQIFHSNETLKAEGIQTSSTLRKLSYLQFISHNNAQSKGVTSADSYTDGDPVILFASFVQGNSVTIYFNVNSPLVSAFIIINNINLLGSISMFSGQLL